MTDEEGYNCWNYEEIALDFFPPHGILYISTLTDMAFSTFKYNERIMLLKSFDYDDYDFETRLNI